MAFQGKETCHMKINWYHKFSLKRKGKRKSSSPLDFLRLSWIQLLICPIFCNFSFFSSGVRHWDTALINGKLKDLWLPRPPRKGSVPFTSLSMRWSCRLNHYLKGFQHQAMNLLTGSWVKNSVYQKSSFLNISMDPQFPVFWINMICCHWGCRVCRE